jgi:hypothetical protein
MAATKTVGATVNTQSASVARAWRNGRFRGNILASLTAGDQYEQGLVSGSIHPAGEDTRIDDFAQLDFGDG